MVHWDGWRQIIKITFKLNVWIQYEHQRCKRDLQRFLLWNWWRIKETYTFNWTCSNISPQKSFIFLREWWNLESKAKHHKDLQGS